MYIIDTSPKRPRRDGKPATKRISSNNHNVEIASPTSADQKHRRWLQDALPLEAPLAPDSKTRPDVVNKGSEKKTEEPPDATKRSSNPTEHSAVYQLWRTCILKAFSEFGSGDKKEATFVIPELRKLSADDKAGNHTVLLFLQGKLQLLPVKVIYLKNNSIRHLFHGFSSSLAWC